MNVSKKIEPKEWMLDPRCQKIMTVLNGDKEEPQALFVGGCVRDILLDKKLSDLDIATKHKPEKVMELCQEKGFKVIPTGLDHGTVTVVVDDKVFEITTLRKDVETDGRRAIVAFSDSWKEDAARRDFTINTLLLDITGQVYDPTGQGVRDMERRAVIFVGNPDQRIKEDYLRILRFFRFYAYYGSGAPDANALKACKENSEKIPNLSRERISQEFFKIAASENSPDILKLMLDNNVLSDVIGELDPRFAQLSERQYAYGLHHLPAKLYFAIGGKISVLEEAEQKYFVFTNSQKRFFKTFEDALDALDKQKNLKILAYAYGKKVVQQIVLASFKDEDVSKALKKLAEWNVPVLPINGNDVVELGIPQGKQLGEYLRKAESWWISKDFEPNRDDILEYLKKLLG